VRTGGSAGSLSIYARSWEVRCGCSDGRWYSGHQKITQINPTKPVAMNAACQCHVSAIQGTIAGARTAPTLVPALKIPVASARSLLGNHSATVLIAAGKLPDSPIPSAKRAAPNPKAERASEWHIAATDHQAMAKET